MDSIVLQTRKIRDYINSPWKHYFLVKDNDKFSQLASSLDVIEDTQSAIDAFQKEQFTGLKGKLYLCVYGLLQSLIVQQDAVSHLCESIGVSETTKKYALLQDIRLIRNKSVGHPTKYYRQKSKGTSYNFINQSSLSKGGFELYAFGSGGELTRKFIDISLQISTQRKLISKILKKVIDNLEFEDMAHKEKYRGEKLEMLFHPGLGYAFEKLYEGVRETAKKAPHLGLAGLVEIKKVLSDFREAVGLRDMSIYENLQYQYDLIEYSIGSLENYLSDKEKKKINHSTALIFVHFLSSQVDELKVFAKEIDEDYSK